ncbi:hypothetical protein AVEN_118438-1 [Araneus ventricosus]|uniref:Uncharacterized protein n=1 Tax=Araneus ventricosus TaxID=182803 RepID=A0A4Y2MAX2_ARAVE|nr:hypothetical protein AVEN_118438-1 [Araneus ventricosus]
MKEISIFKNRYKAGHSPLFQSGIFRTWERNTYRQGRKPVKFGANDSKWWNSKELKIQSSIRRFKFETSMRGKRQNKGSAFHWHLASRLEMKLEIPRLGEEDSGWEKFCDFEPRFKTNFGTSVNALPNFSTKIGGGGKPVLGQMAQLSLLVNAQLKTDGHV